MLVLGRRENQWTMIRHRKSGEVLWCKLWGFDGKVSEGWHDPENEFEIVRGEIIDMPSPSQNERQPA